LLTLFGFWAVAFTRGASAAGRPWSSTVPGVYDPTWEAAFPPEAPPRKRPPACRVTAAVLARGLDRGRSVWAGLLSRMPATVCKREVVMVDVPSAPSEAWMLETLAWAERTGKTGLGLERGVFLRTRKVSSAVRRLRKQGLVVAEVAPED